MLSKKHLKIQGSLTVCEGESSLIHDPTCEKHALHCEKSLFVSVFRQKITSKKGQKILLAIPEL
jgi:hypothetical protein